jgi:DNA-binding transcriptional LysR family regulator
VAAGTGFAVVPKSVLGALQAGGKVREHKLPARIAANRTHLVWRGEASLALEGLMAMLADEAGEEAGEEGPAAQAAQPALLGVH